MLPNKERGGRACVHEARITKPTGAGVGVGRAGLGADGEDDGVAGITVEHAATRRPTASGARRAAGRRGERLFTA
jgi:hypothetical protein